LWDCGGVSARALACVENTTDKCFEFAEQKHTRHIISTDEFAKMKEGVVIVNTARGAVMDEDALVKALDSGRVFSCGLDVYEDEPAVHPGLIARPNVMLVPHMGTWTVEASTPLLRL
jgi:D-3-phosphoglycerate dehydrogenase